tara:strand:+ start:1034 stop:1534 length:501 start_codon:yes stop_codon:yes gene_type:complete
MKPFFNVLLTVLFVGALAGVAGAQEDEPQDPWFPVRMCESTNNYQINTGNGFYGAYQFTIRTWDWIAGVASPEWVGVLPHLAPAEVQDLNAETLRTIRNGGLGHWPVCGLLYDHSVSGDVAPAPAVHIQHALPMPVAELDPRYSRPTQIILMRYNHDPVDPLGWTR